VSGGRVEGGGEAKQVADNATSKKTTPAKNNSFLIRFPFHRQIYYPAGGKSNR